MEIVYILTNSCMPNIVKIGRTEDLDKRLKELYKTGVPLPFECFFACTVKDADFVEKSLHDAFKEQRVNPRREFFEIDPNRVISALKLAMLEDVTPTKDISLEDEEDKKTTIDALEKMNRRRSSFNFEMVGIKKGAELSFCRNESVKAKVIDSKNIEYEGETTSLSSLATKLLGFDYTVQGPRYWMYENETLLERRKRIEEG